MDKPIEVKEFWEGCGLKHKDGGGEDMYGWYKDGILIKQRLPIDLNNLSRYAIPKLIEEYRNWKSVLHDWVDELTGDYEKDALALFRSLYPIITGKEAMSYEDKD